MTHAGVRAGRNTNVRPDPRQELQELLAFVRRQITGQPALVLHCSREGLVEELTTGLRQKQRPSPAVIWILPALEQPPFLQSVDKSHHPAGRDSHLLGDRLLSDAL